MQSKTDAGVSVSSSQHMPSIVLKLGQDCQEVCTMSDDSLYNMDSSITCLLHGPG